MKSARQLGDYVLNNVWIPDGMKDVPADRLGPRMRLKDSRWTKSSPRSCPNVIDCVESKVFGIGRGSYTVGSHEFYMSYAGTHPGVYNLLDNGHYHPTEVVSDKIPALLCFFDKIAAARNPSGALGLRPRRRFRRRAEGDHEGNRPQ